VLSIDGTYSYKGKTLYIFRSYEKGVVLYANTTEKDDVPHFQPLLEKVVGMYGLPMAVISDMQSAIIESVKNVMPNIPHQYCQYHFIKNAGSFMEKEYKELGTAIKKKEVLGRVVLYVRPRLHPEDEQ
jgi:MULE transposase domain.